MKTMLANKFETARRNLGIPRARPTIREVLATTDFSEESQSGVRYAVAFAQKLGATVALLHVIELPSRLAGMEAVPLACDDSEWAALAGAQLKKLAERESKKDFRLTTRLRAGKAFHEICAAAAESSADLIVIATHGYTGAQRVLLGSTAECVVRHAPCPVLTVRQPNATGRVRQTPQLKLRKILVPIDFSNLSKAALPWATFLAKQFRAEIVLLHAVEKFPIDDLLGRELLNHTMVPLMKQSEADLERIATGLSQSTGVNVAAAVREGRPYEEICAAAKALAADLIVLTTHGYTGLKHIWLGSTAERVVRHALCPVLVVREVKA